LGGTQGELWSRGIILFVSGVEVRIFQSMAWSLYLIIKTSAMKDYVKEDLKRVRQKREV
jgi:hypothetical protein